MKEAKFIRQGQVISNVVTGEKVDHKSISKAKHCSLVWQKANGVLGDGQLRVKR